MRICKKCDKYYDDFLTTCIYCRKPLEFSKDDLPEKIWYDGPKKLIVTIWKIVVSVFTILGFIILILFGLCTALVCGSMALNSHL